MEKNIGVLKYFDNKFYYTAVCLNYIKKLEIKSKTSMVGFFLERSSILNCLLYCLMIFLNIVLNNILFIARQVAGTILGDFDYSFLRNCLISSLNDFINSKSIGQR